MSFGDNYGFNNMNPQMIVQQQMFQPFQGNQQAQGGQKQQGKGAQGKGNQQRYEKKDKATSSPSTGTKAKKSDKGEQKKYVTKQKKDETPKKASNSKPVEGNASQ